MTLDSKREMAAKKAALIDKVSMGMTIASALEAIDRHQKTYENWRRSDADFVRRIEHAKALQKINVNSTIRGEVLPFEEWRLKYLGQETYLHQLQWIDLLEGREPRELHPAQTYQRGTDRNLILVNCPPEHAKSQTITIDYVTYRICLDPSFRCIIISASQTMAKRMVYGIKSRLIHPNFRALQEAYAPEGGWRQSADSWSATEIYLDSDSRDGIEKDPTVQALGWTGQIYGARANLVILDDGVDKRNVRQYDSQREWLDTEPASRLGSTGKFLVVGTRMSAVDLYSELMNPDNYIQGVSPWNYLASPAILEFGEEADGSDNVTLWPYSTRSWDDSAARGDSCFCGTVECREGYDLKGRHVYPRWDGLHIQRFRKRMSPSRFSLVYQQTAVPEDAIFPEYAIRACSNGYRGPGLLKKDTIGHPLGGMHDMRVIAGCDPAVSGFAGIVVIAFDPKTQKRYLLQALNIKAPTPERLKNEMFRLTEEYGIQEWRVEKTGLLKLFTQDRTLREWFAKHNVRFKEHQTDSSTKWDPSYGVASMEPMFGQWKRETDKHGKPVGDWEAIIDPLIEFPGARHGKTGFPELIHQLSIWTPELDPSKVPCDMVMALWFADIGCREQPRPGRKADPYRNAKKFISPQQRQRSLFLVAASGE